MSLLIFACLAINRLPARANRIPARLVTHIPYHEHIGLVWGGGEPNQDEKSVEGDFPAHRTWLDKGVNPAVRHDRVHEDSRPVEIEQTLHEAKSYDYESNDDVETCEDFDTRFDRDAAATRFVLFDRFTQNGHTSFLAACDCSLVASWFVNHNFERGLFYDNNSWCELVHPWKYVSIKRVIELI